jgi:hypothetical protein
MGGKGEGGGMRAGVGGKVVPCLTWIWRGKPFA